MLQELLHWLGVKLSVVLLKFCVSSYTMCDNVMEVSSLGDFRTSMGEGGLSLGRRIALTQSCFYNISLFILSLFEIPVAIANRFERLMRDTLWSGDIQMDYPMSWK